MHWQVRNPTAPPTARIPKLTSSVHDISAEKPPFGSRFLTDDSDVWAQNAWDHVPPPDDQAETIAASLHKQRLAPVPGEDKDKYNSKPAKYWDNFYKTNADNFFRDRKWLTLEFPELLAAAEPEAGEITICEIGCGAGNAAFPLLSANKNPKLTIRAYDYSSHAVKLVQNNPLYATPAIGSIQAAVWDLSSENSHPPGVEPGTVDMVLCVFVLSALHPDEWGKAVSNIHRMLKPGGVLLVRDYGRYDLTQLRFKSGRLLDDNFYIRGDKTRVYFFESDELALMFTGSRASPSQKTIRTTEETEESQSQEDGTPSIPSPALHTPPPQLSGSQPAGLSTEDVYSQETSSDQGATMPKTTIHPNLLTPLAGCPPHPLFAIEQLGVDRRLLVNRKRQLKMYRVWMQGKFRKLPGAGEP
ncbi:S-adenosyl-L-methionine-dependent methyltransferase [Melanogaster broomeanus]|nr:S-adenosyl-L-methionine-dependent methyltransferase [Melanogaster broomeanus]